MINYFNLTQQNLIELKGFSHIEDRIYVKPLRTIPSLSIYAAPRPNCIALPVLSTDESRYISPEYRMTFERYHMFERLFFYIEATNSYVPSRLPIPSEN